MLNPHKLHTMPFELPLNYSILNNSSKEIIAYLVKKGANPNLQDQKGRNAFQCVYHNRSEVDLVYLLLANGAKIKYHQENETHVQYDVKKKKKK